MTHGRNDTAHTGQVAKHNSPLKICGMGEIHLRLAAAGLWRTGLRFELLFGFMRFLMLLWRRSSFLQVYLSFRGICAQCRLSQTGNRSVAFEFRNKVGITVISPPARHFEVENAHAEAPYAVIATTF